MNNYNFNPNTKEYIGYIPAHLDPLETEIQGEDVFLLPMNATHEPVPETGANEVAVWDVWSGEWNVEADFRGQVYYERFGEEKVVSEIGELVPTGADYSLDEPPEEIRYPKLYYGAWIEQYPMYQGADGIDHRINVKEDVDKHTRERIAISGVGEEKAKTLKMLAGEGACPEWDEWLTLRQALIDNGNTFCDENFPS